MEIAGVSPSRTSSLSILAPSCHRFLAIFLSIGETTSAAVESTRNLSCWSGSGSATAIRTVSITNFCSCVSLTGASWTLAWGLAANFGLLACWAAPAKDRPKTTTAVRYRRVFCTSVTPDFYDSHSWASDIYEVNEASTLHQCPGENQRIFMRCVIRRGLSVLLNPKGVGRH